MSHYYNDGTTVIVVGDTSSQATLALSDLVAGVVIAKTYGAFADGIHPDDAAIALAIAAAAGRPVLLGPGAWLFSGLLAIPAGQTVLVAGGALTTVTLNAGATIAANAALRIGLGCKVFTAGSIQLIDDGAQLVGACTNHTVTLAPNIFWIGANGASLANQNAIVTAAGSLTPAGLYIKGIWVSRNGRTNITGFRNDVDIGYSIVEDFTAQPITYGIHLHRGCGQSKFTRFLLAANDAADTQFDTGVLIEGNSGGIISCVFEQFTIAQHSRYGIRIAKVGGFDGAASVWFRDGDIESTSGTPSTTAIACISITSALAVYVEKMHMESPDRDTATQAAIELGDSSNTAHYPRCIAIRDCNWGPFQHGVRGYGWQDLLIEGNQMDNVQAMFFHAAPAGVVRSGGRWINNAPITTAVLAELDSAVGFDLVVKDGGSNGGNNGPLAPEMNLANMLLRKAPTLTASLPAAGATQDGRVEVEDAGANVRNLVLYSGATRYRITGTAF